MIKLDFLKEAPQIALQKAVLLVEAEAKKKAPVDTGELRASITSYVEGNEGYVGTNKEYAPYIEFGTGLFAENGDGRKTPWVYEDEKGEWHTTTGQSPQPYLRPALEENKEKILQIFKDAINNG